MTELEADRAFGQLLGEPAVSDVLTELNGTGRETRIVGGAIRNILLDRPVSDIDLATTLLPQEVMEQASSRDWKAIPTGLEHGTVTVVVDGRPFEITTLREDMETDGRHAVVKFGRDFEQDAKRRDFTINALSLDITGRIHDYCNGLDDIAGRRIRFIGDPHQRIREDYLRILRFFRFHAQYGEGIPDADGLRAVIDEGAGLARVSTERIRAEMLKLLQGTLAPDVIMVMMGSGILARILPGAFEPGRLRRLKACGSGFPPILLFAALKIMVREDAGFWQEKLRLSNHEYKVLTDYANLLEFLKSMAGPLKETGIPRLVADWSPELVVAALAAINGEPRPSYTKDVFTRLRGFLDGSEPVPVFPLRGADLIAEGIPKGPEVGALLQAARNLWLNEGCPLDTETARRLLEQVLAERDAR